MFWCRSTKAYPNLSPWLAPCLELCVKLFNLICLTIYFVCMEKMFSLRTVICFICMD